MRFVTLPRTSHAVYSKPGNVEHHRISLVSNYPGGHMLKLPRAYLRNVLISAKLLNEGAKVICESETF